MAEGEKISVILVESADAKLAEMREAMNDPLFLADLQEIVEDFQSIQMGTGKGDSIAEIEKYWGDANADDIDARIARWKKDDHHQNHLEGSVC